MSNAGHLGKIGLPGLLAESIQADATIRASALAVDAALVPVFRAIPKMLLWARLWQDESRLSPPMRRIVETAGGLPPLSDEELELLAWQLHVDFWRPEWPRYIRESLVKNATRWHRIKGTPAGVKAALELFGIGADIEEDGTGADWATWQLGLKTTGVGLPWITGTGPINPALETARIAHMVATEMQPQRCRLFRIYNSDFDLRPLIFTTSPGWSEGFYSFYSGMFTPGIDDDLVVSLGARHSMTTEPINPEAAIMHSTSLALYAPYLDKFLYSFSRYGDVLPLNHGFMFSELFSHGWPEPKRTPFIFPARSISRSQAAYSEGFPLYDGGTVDGWGDSNFRYGTTRAVVVDNPANWSGFSWSGHDPERRELTLHEMHIATHTAESGPLEPGTGFSFAFGLGARLETAAAPLHNQTWSGRWDSRRWNNYIAFLSLTREPKE